MSPADNQGTIGPKNACMLVLQSSRRFGMSYNYSAVLSCKASANV
jgi:hypothetical protein